MKRLLVFIPVMLIISLFGCNDHSTTPETGTQASVDQAEMPASVEKMLTNFAFADEKDTPDPQVIYLDPIPTELTSDCDIYAVTFLWGDIFGPIPQTIEPTDWSGRFALNQDCVVHVRYMIDFEKGQD